MRLLTADSETTGLDVIAGPDRAFRIAWLSYDDETGEIDEQFLPVDIHSIQQFQQMLNWADEVIFHNAVFDAAVLAHEGINLPWEKTHDSLIAAALLVDQDKSKSELALSLKYLNYRGNEHVAVDDFLRAHKSVGKVDYTIIPDKILKPYTLVQLRNIAQLWLKWKDTIYNDYAEIYGIERQIPPIILAMEQRGVRIDTERLLVARESIKASLQPEGRDLFSDIDVDPETTPDALIFEIRHLGVPYDFNPSSNQQVAAFLISKGVQLHQTPSGQYSTDVHTLKRIPLYPLLSSPLPPISWHARG